MFIGNPNSLSFLRMTNDFQSEAIVQLLIDNQARIRSVINTLVPDRAAADDVVQETNMVIWRKAGEFERGTDFGAWACKIAYLQVKSYREKQNRDRLIFDDGTLSALADLAATRNDHLEERRSALRKCMGKLRPEYRAIITSRYSEGLSVSKLAEKLNRPIGSIKQTMYRIRESLRNCIAQALKRGDAS